MNTDISRLETSQDNPGVTFMPPSVFFICLMAGGLLHVILPLELPLLSGLWPRIAGVVFGAAGFGFMLLAHEKFKSVDTHVPTDQPAACCVSTGAYRFSRNPMYVGGSAFFLGLGAAAGSVWMLAAWLPLGIYLAAYVVPREEAYMERRFGEEYLAYCRTVRRWL
ncbi:MAG: isoprenylcysteine carboxylmethyltransferase family protein [Desulfobacter sp.]|nr:MAG: isoprenylcysteine carboxylmethyltransferase family protein [Desulfobacter sp.]